MNVPEKDSRESILEYSARLSEWHSGIHNTQIRKGKGQFFTPKKVAEYMASLFELENGTLRILDPGAGTGVLTAAICNRILNEKKRAKIVIDIFENDDKVIPILTKVLETCKKEFGKKSLSFDFNIYQKDFVSQNIRRLNRNSSLLTKDENVTYELVISNPPYFKLKKDMLNASLERALSGHPNIYSVFMELSLCMLNKGGELVFITPRSFCSGAYYRKFRKTFLRDAVIRDIHLFESRKDIFDADGVLQETIILRANKSDSNQVGNVNIRLSKNKALDDFSCFKAHYSDVVHRVNGDIFIRIPTSTSDLDTLHFMDDWPNTLHKLGLEISTGPVVSFRAKDFQFSELQKELKTVPLLWMHNLQGMGVVWPLKKNGKSQAILASRDTEQLLLNVRNLVLIKRFTSKEQQRRLYASVLEEEKFPFKLVGLENHINYVHQINGNMSNEMAVGIASLLNSEMVDYYFRSLNGNTQVNASDIRNLPLPSKEEIMTIGRLVHSALSNQEPTDIDSIVGKVLNNKIPAVALSN